MIEVVIDQRRRSIGSFEVGRVLPSAERHMVGRFIFFDHIGPVDLPKGLPRGADVRPHPHIALSTVTYLLAGEVMRPCLLPTCCAISTGYASYLPV